MGFNERRKTERGKSTSVPSELIKIRVSTSLPDLMLTVDEEEM